MKKIITKYSGVVLLYSVIIVGVFVLNERFKYLNTLNEKTTTNIVAIGRED